MSAAKRNPLELPKGLNQRCDLPPEAYWHADRTDYTPFAVRPGYSKSGTDIRVLVNQFRVESVTGRDVYQYDVTITPEPSGAIVYKKVWNTPLVKAKLAEFKAPWLYDNRKLAWSTAKVSNVKIEVDLGADEGRPGRKNNVFVLQIQQTCKVRMESLKAYLEKRAPWDNSVLECMSFLDHALRQGPSERMELIKRTFINENSATKILNPCTEAIKGIYSAIRLSDSLKSGGLGLGVNVDVTNQTFWIGQGLEHLVRNYLGWQNPRQWGNLNTTQMAGFLKPVNVRQKDGTVRLGPSEAFKLLKKLQGIRFVVKHRGSAGQPRKEYKIRRFHFDPSFGTEGAHAKNVTFEKKMEDGSTKKYTIADYYLRTYKTRVMHPLLPLVETINAGLFPMELCEVVRFNRYAYKLDPEQTSAMITFSQARPDALKPEIEHMVRNLDWANDRYLAHFGVKISTKMPVVQAKLLPNPVVKYANTTKNPGTRGRWDLMGAKFVQSPFDVKKWAVVIVDQRTDRATAQNFGREFKTAYMRHGGKISSDPVVLELRGNDIENDMAGVVGTMTQKLGGFPHLVFFILAQKKQFPYDRLKRQADCRFGFISQMVLGQHAKKCQGQYLSNVCLKVNAKLGGRNSALESKTPLFAKPTMMIGVDVSHGQTAEGSVSTAAMCASMDRDCAVYSAAVQTNGWRVEILQEENMWNLLGQLVTRWRNRNKMLPEHVFYMRDGVSEGQFAHVMDIEVRMMRTLFKEHFKTSPKITVIVATKRHHIRLFPERGDKNNNCLPGTLVEREVTHPFHYDFYLCSHAALQGTARPVHYNVIHDEVGLPHDTLQRILYEQCYQYCRSTTPVSLHPAVYYAHLAADRARWHEPSPDAAPVQPNGKFQVLHRAQGPMAKAEVKTATSRPKDAQPPPLLAIGQGNPRPECKPAIDFFKGTMWWV
ncbi:hypothetical protein VTJ83DRAFT_3212 [Remersonia thermophila]|uniref:Piwi domain-containing protein n=1 Tax=Remersonia thermophila TaxID=72144 RepID=A0ABR4DDE7_9PEZI